MQIVNFESVAVQVTISTTGLQASIDVLRSTATVITSSNVMDENSFSNPNKVIYIFPLVHKMAYQLFLQSSKLIIGLDLHVLWLVWIQNSLLYNGAGSAS